jgi:DNA-binding MarR family transcriptional regulator
VHHTRDIDGLAGTLIELISFLNSPRRDEALLREAGVDLDRALFPLLIRLGMHGPLSVASLADQAGRDHTTISRQLAKLESLGLISRQGGGGDRRVRTASLTGGGEGVVQAIASARRRLLSRALAKWSGAERADLARLSRRFVDALADAAQDGPRA